MGGGTAQARRQVNPSAGVKRDAPGMEAGAAGATVDLNNMQFVTLPGGGNSTQATQESRASVPAGPRAASSGAKGDAALGSLGPRAPSRGKTAKSKTAKVSKTPTRWPRSWANFSLLSLHFHRNAWANLHVLGQPNTFLAQGQDCQAQGSARRWRRDGKIHRVEPDFGSTLTDSNNDSQSNCWVNWKIMGQPCVFQVAAGAPSGASLNLGAGFAAAHLYIARTVQI